MANTFVKIASATVGSGGTGEIVFSSIPQTYTDLKVLISARAANSAIANSLYIGFNGGYTGGNSIYLAGDGTTPSSSISSNALIGDISANSSTSNTFGSLEVYIPNYTKSTTKSYSSESVSENNATTAFAELWVGYWSGTAAITELRFSASANLMQYSTATLYGIKKN
jgi:hypothetical protein